MKHHMKNVKFQSQIKDLLLLSLLVLAVALPGLANLPVIDRDEARYAQASVQMLETGDYVNIRFQDRARNKKPAGSYWLQAASVNMFSDVEKREIWPHRLPSVLGALLAIFATYLGGRRLLGREVALTGSALLAISMIFIFEAHIAKTDALLCGFSALVLASFAFLRNGGGRKSALLFWIALGGAVMIKGPILPLLIFLCVVSLAVWERTLAWLKPLRFWPGPLIFLLIVLPWMILIWQETNGAFFTDAIGGDLTPKLKGGHETHGGPPGYYFASTWFTLWPTCLFLLPGLAFTFRAALKKESQGIAVSRAARLLLCWSIPFFILMEIVPTKLPHYTLPIYPALALMSAAAVITLAKVKEFPTLRRINAVIFCLLSIALIGGLLFAESYYGAYPTWSFAVLGLAMLICVFAAIQLWVGKGKTACIAIILAALMVNIPTYQLTLPSLEALLVSRNVKTAFRDIGITLPLTGEIEVISPQFTEPSLVHGLGTRIILGQPQERLQEAPLENGDILILDRERTETEQLRKDFESSLSTENRCLKTRKTVDGFNYSKGDPVKLDILSVIPCPAAAILPTPDSP